MDSLGTVQRLLESWWEEATQKLTERERFILECRYPDVLDEVMTLEAIGDRLGITRERVRQLRNRALGKLDVDGVASPELDRLVWRQASGAEGVVVQDPDFPRMISARLDGLTRLYIELSFGGVEAWLRATCHHVDGVFHKWEVSQEDVRSAEEDLAAFCDHVNARPIPEAQSEDPAWRLAIAKSSEVKEYGGHLCHAPLTDARCRTIDLHNILQRQGRPTSLYRLWALARRTGLEVSLQDVQRSVTNEDFANLFLDCGDFGVTSTLMNERLVPGHGTGHTDYLGDLSCYIADDLPAALESLDESTATGTLVSILAETGPLPTREILSIFEGKSRTSSLRSSAQAMLVIHPGFVRLAPGCFGLVRHLLEIDPVSEVSAFLLTESDVHWYVTARTAGEPINAYPLWTPAMEQAWVTWGLAHLPRDVFGRLASISEPSRWPSPGNLPGPWPADAPAAANPSQKRGPKKVIDVASVDLTGLIAVACVAQDQGKMNWVKANRILGRRLDAGTGAAAVGLLTLLELLTPGKAWYGPHVWCSKGEAVLRQLVGFIQDGETLSWEHPEGRRLWDSLRHRTPESPLLWVRNSLQFGEPSTRTATDADPILTRLLEQYGASQQAYARSRLLQELQDDDDG